MSKNRSSIGQTLPIRQKNKEAIKIYYLMILLKMPLISVWFKLSDVRTEEFMKDSTRFTTFCGLDIGAVTPNHSILSN
ncbi:MAG: transposase [Flavobacteriaceae bacterium]|nr:transposase [Flavobacteriaceae bacterium]MCY4253627.1 transposase [Flavobacteriaceae bacterium]